MKQNAGLLRRFGAILYDALLVVALLILASIPFVAVRGGQIVEPDDNLFYQLCMLLVIYLFFVGFWTRKGRTLGMQSWGMQLETDGGKRVNVNHLRSNRFEQRFVAAIVSWLPLGLGFAWQLWDRDGLSWHDRLSRTRLVYYPKIK